MLIELFGGPLDGLGFEHNAESEAELKEDPEIYIEGEHEDGVDLILYIYKGGGFAIFEGKSEMETLQ